MPRGAPIGATVTLTCNGWHGPDPEPGDFITTDAGSAYLVEHVRLSAARKGPITCTKFDIGAIPEDAVVHEWVWSPRGR